MGMGVFLEVIHSAYPKHVQHS